MLSKAIPLCALGVVDCCTHKDLYTRTFFSSRLTNDSHEYGSRERHPRSRSLFAFTFTSAFTFTFSFMRMRCT